MKGKKACMERVIFFGLICVGGFLLFVNAVNYAQVSNRDLSCEVLCTYRDTSFFGAVLLVIGIVATILLNHVEKTRTR